MLFFETLFKLIIEGQDKERSIAGQLNSAGCGILTTNSIRKGHFYHTRRSDIKLNALFI